MTTTTEVLSLDVGPQHPATHGTLRVRVSLDGDRIVEAEPIVGYLHRGVEKLFEVRDYRQIIVLANRHDWLSAFSSELGVALAIERMLGIEVPPRATWLRMLMAELNRVLNHLMFLGSYAFEVEPDQPRVHGFVARERIQTVMEEATGGRMHFMFNRVGGLKEDLPSGWLDRVAEVTDLVRRDIEPIADFFQGDGSVLARTVGVGVLSRQLALQFGVSGAPARASGVDFDVRRDDPYLAYAELADEGVLRIPTSRTGDAHARFVVLVEQVRVALDIVEACIDRIRALGPGPIGVRTPKILKAPEGSTYCWTENPLGINGYFLESRGEKTPWRLKLRTASFNTVSSLSQVLPGNRVADLTAILASCFFVVGDIDK